MDNNITSTFDLNKSLVPKRELWALSGGMFGQSFISAFMGAFLFIYYTRIGIAPWVVGLVVGTARIWDAFNDPILGAVIDRRKPSKNGKLRPLVLYTSIPIGIITILLFFVPKDINIYAQCSMILVLYLSWDVFYTIHDISKWGLTARMSPNPNDRSKLVSYGKILMEVGLVIPQIVMLLIDEGNMAKISEATGLNLTFESVMKTSAIIFGISGGLIMSISYFTKERVQFDNPPQSLAKDVGTIFKNRTLMCLLSSMLLGCIMFNLGTDYYFFATMGVTITIFGNTLGGTNALAIYAILISVPAALGMPFANMLGKRIGMKSILIIAAFLPFFIRLICFFIGFEGQRFIIVMILMAISTIPRGMHGIAYMTIITDSIDYVEWKIGRRTEGTTFAMNTLLNKSAGGINTILAGFTLTLLKFDPTVIGTGEPISAEFTRWAWALFMLAPAISILLGAIPLFFINFVGKYKENILKELSDRRKSCNQESN